MEGRSYEGGTSWFGQNSRIFGGAMNEVLSHVGGPTGSVSTRPRYEPGGIEERRKFPRFWVQFPISLLNDGVME